MFLAKLLKNLFFNPAEKVYKLGFISESNLGERKTDVRDLGVGSRRGGLAARSGTEFT